MEEKKAKEKKRTLVGFGCFLGFMALCTLITKGIYASQMPVVTVEKPEQRALTHDIMIRGTVRPGQNYGIYVQEGLRVETLYEGTGSRVEEGARLFQVRMEDLEQMIAHGEADIRRIEALLADEAGRKREESQERQRSLLGMQESYDSMIRECDLAIEKKQLAYDTAVRRREQAENAFASVSGGDADSLEGLRLAEGQAALEVEEAVLTKEDAIREWNRQYADTKRAGYADSAETVSLEDQLKQSQTSLEKLKALYRAKGVVSAPEDGIIVENRLKTGEYTPDTACMLYVEEGGTGVLEFNLEDENILYVAIGDRVDISYNTESGEKKHQESVISYVEDRGTYGVARTALPGAELMVGQGVTLKAQYVTESYSLVIPRQSLVEENGFYYIYVVEEQAGFLGTEERVRKVSVNLTDSNLSAAAVECSSLSLDSRVVVYTDKELSDGDVVRVIR